ncbi:MAG TPA: undecaprenyldiphospho-muramoylpentapeptide beta-N-acetylglucosaminyltransferase [Actinomycetota bacterium]
MKVVIAAGGTAGHIAPGLALGRTLRDRGADVTFVGTQERLEARLVPAAGFPFEAIPAAPFQRRLSPTTLRAPIVAWRAAARCRPIVRDAAVVVGMGGYVSVPTVLAARREAVPIVLHEQNAVPGLANRALSVFADAVGLSFADGGRFFRRRRAKVVVTGNPVRETIARVPEDRTILAKEAREELGLAEDRMTILVFGGSQGALHLDRAAAGACRLLANRGDLQVILITGSAHFDPIRAVLPGVEGMEGDAALPSSDRPAENPATMLVRAFAYLERMELAYAVADLAVARAGASTVAELSVCGVPALLVPYPYATGRHQEANAKAMQRAGGASVMPDDQVSAASLAARIQALIDHEERLRAMSERSAAFGRSDAGSRLADLVMTAARRDSRS